MPTDTAITDDLARAVLTGLELRKQRIEEQIDELRRALKQGGVAPTKAFTVKQTAAKTPSKRFSAETRKRMAEAQRRRWAAARKA